MSFEDFVKSVKEKVNSLLTKEAPKETIDLVADINKDIDSMQESHAKLAKDKADLQEMYIDQVKHSGSSEKPKEDEPEKPKTFEEIGQALINAGKE